MSYARTPDAILADPIVMRALEARGLDPSSLEWDDGDEVIVNGTRDLPAVTVRLDGTASISWYRAEGMVRYVLDREGGILTVERQETPETLLAALAGRTADALVGVPGAGLMRIVEAVNSSAFTGDPYDTRASVEPIGAA